MQEPSDPVGYRRTTGQVRVRVWRWPGRKEARRRGQSPAVAWATCGLPGRDIAHVEQAPFDIDTFPPPR
jgi:hypothetical protein